jgi:hypothetical protein
MILATTLFRSSSMAVAGFGLSIGVASCGSADPALEPEPEPEPVDIAGMYEATHHTQNDSGCDEGGNLADPPFFRVASEGSMGAAAYTLGLCGSDDAASCVGTGLEGVVFDQPSEGGWKGVEDQAILANARCHYIHLEMSAMLDAASEVIRIELRKSEELVDSEFVECTIEEAESRAASLPCVSLEVLEGVRVDP